MTPTYLDKIVASHRARAARDARDWRVRSVQSDAHSLAAALRSHRGQGNAVIAEVKRKSPSKGWLSEYLDPKKLAASYASGGASAVSVLTDEEHFGGSVADLRLVREVVDVPLLRKDFTVSINDVLDTVEMGASAVLLIVSALSIDELREFHDVALSNGIDALVEVHDVEEADIALSIGATLIGVNQRDLHSFAVDAERAEKVAASIPSSVVAVAESGFGSPEAVRRAASSGFDAVLVGESFVTSSDPTTEVASFVGFPIGSRA
ncbi:MAG: indole-3-glycerol-phosphate synthase [Actinobacteria bacterium]|nr:indole-3-glycerol-phosphate synthase [Actinomycetota bacterium]